MMKRWTDQPGSSAHGRGDPDCCMPGAVGAAREPVERLSGFQKGYYPAELLCSIEAGKALRGTNFPIYSRDGESPLRAVDIRAFAIATITVTNAQFRSFVESTGHVTDAEKAGGAFVFLGGTGSSFGAKRVSGMPWWAFVPGACWRAPLGAADEAWCDPDHPVTQVSWTDAAAYAEFVGGRLPSEVEWEHAARGGLGDVPYPWGTEEPTDRGSFPCNIWQGDLSTDNLAYDGCGLTAPARSFEPNGYGLYNMVGNVWEWCADARPAADLGGKSAGTPRAQADRAEDRVLKGGSFLCHVSYCHRYRIAARMFRPHGLAIGHVGFRVAFDL